MLDPDVFAFKSVETVAWRTGPGHHDTMEREPRGQWGAPEGSPVVASPNGQQGTAQVPAGGTFPQISTLCPRLLSASRRTLEGHQHTPSLICSHQTSKWTKTTLPPERRGQICPALPSFTSSEQSRWYSVVAVLLLWWLTVFQPSTMGFQRPLRGKAKNIDGRQTGHPYT